MNSYQPDVGISKLKINELKPMASGIKTRLAQLVDEYNDSLTKDMPAKQTEIEHLMCRSVDIDNAYRRFNRQPSVSYSMPRHNKKSKTRLTNVFAQIEELSVILAELIQRFIQYDTRQAKAKVDTMYEISKKLGQRHDIQAANSRTKTVTYASSISHLNAWRK
jgi:hypothetical protein